jgi:Zn-dependent peptidase ImmA (M78 family)
MMPHRGVMQKFQEFTAGSPRLTRRHIIVLAHYFNVSREAMVRRLEELKVTKPGTWDWFEDNGGITDEQAHQVLGDLVPADAAKVEAELPTTLRLNMLASEAWRQNLLTEGQLMRLLHMDRVELRRLLDRIDTEGEADEAPVLPV